MAGINHSLQNDGIHRRAGAVELLAGNLQKRLLNLNGNVNPVKPSVELNAKKKTSCKSKRPQRFKRCASMVNVYFMPAKSVTMSENARSTYQGNLDKWIYPALGDLKMPDITPANISTLLLSMQSAGKAHATVIKVYTVLSGLFKMAYLSDTIARNPMDKVERPKPRKDEVHGNEVEAYTVEEVCYLLKCLENEPLKWQVFLPATH